MNGIALTMALARPHDASISSTQNSRNADVWTRCRIKWGNQILHKGYYHANYPI